MKTTLTLLGALALAATAQAQAQNAAHKLTKVWETKADLKTPESVRFDARRKVLYVSNIDGEPWAVDGKGSIAKVGLDGKIIKAEWVKGLDCPKGLAISDDGKQLYVADAGAVVTVDIKSGKIRGKVAIPEGLQLNDLVNDGQGTLYVSDSKGKKVFAVREGKASVYLDESVLKGPNGLLVHQGTLYVLDNNSLNRVEPDKSLKVLADGMTGGADGLENARGNDFIVTVWQGGIWYVNADGGKQLLFDGKAEKTSTADIGWDPATMTVYVPTFFKNTVVAYKVD